MAAGLHGGLVGGAQHHQVAGLRVAHPVAIAQQHGGQGPRDMAQLVQLPGVARKTANVVLGVAYRIAAGVVVDTHVTRVSQRLGLSVAKTAEKVEQDLCAALPRE